MKIKESNYLEQLRLHNEKALLYVIENYGGLLMSVIRKTLFRLPERQEECLDDVLLKIWTNISAFDENRNTFQNWAAAIAKYRAIDYLREYQRELDVLHVEDITIAKEDRQLAALVERELSEEMEQLLSCLKPTDRELFLKLYVEEQSVEQISAETGLKREVIYNRISRGKNKIRKQSQQYEQYKQYPKQQYQ